MKKPLDWRRTRTSPNPEIPTQDGRASFDGCEGADPSLAVGRVPEAFHAVPYCAADALEKGRRLLVRGLRDGQRKDGWLEGRAYPHAESTTEVLKSDPRARIS